MNFTCPKCDRTAFPSFVLGNSGKLVAQCTNEECLFTDASLSPQDFNTGIAALDGDGKPGWGGKREVIVTPEVQPMIAAQPAAPLRAPFGVKPQPIASGPLAPPTAPALSMPFQPLAQRDPGDVVAWIESRSLWLAAEEARLAGERAELDAKLAGVRAESKRLTKMIRAAHRDAEPTPPRTPKAMRN